MGFLLFITAIISAVIESAISSAVSAPRSRPAGPYIFCKKSFQIQKILDNLAQQLRNRPTEEPPRTVSQAERNFNDQLTLLANKINDFEKRMATAEKNGKFNALLKVW